MPIDIEAMGSDRLSVAERLELIEKIWDSLPESVEPSELPEWHLAEAAKRRDSAEARPREGKPWREVLDRLVSLPPGCGGLSDSHETLDLYRHDDHWLSHVGDRQRRTIPIDVELQAPCQRVPSSPNRGRLSRPRIQTTFHLHAPGNHGRLTTSSDPIVDEIKRFREQYASRFNYDLKAIVRDLQRRQRDGNPQIVRRPPRRPQESAFPHKAVGQGDRD